MKACNNGSACGFINSTEIHVASYMQPYCFVKIKVQAQDFSNMIMATDVLGSIRREGTIRTVEGEVRLTVVGSTEVRLSGKSCGLRSCSKGGKKQGRERRKGGGAGVGEKEMGGEWKWTVRMKEGVAEGER